MKRYAIVLVVEAPDEEHAHQATTTRLCTMQAGRYRPIYISDAMEAPESREYSTHGVQLALDDEGDSIAYLEPERWWVVT